MVIYAPHITKSAAMHPEIEEIGYHCRDYFLEAVGPLPHVHWGELAHSTHLRGAGTYDAVSGEHDSGDGHAGHRHPGGRRSAR